MEDNIQTIIVVIISAFLLFIFPVYMAYEKKDDISYALAIRYTQDLVDEVRSKGYLTKNMYEDYRAQLKLTGNSYDIQMTHEYNRYDPIVNYYKKVDGNYTLVKTSTVMEKQQYELEQRQQAIALGKLNNNSSKSEIDEYINTVYGSQGIDKVESTYRISKETYTTNYIKTILNSERKLQLNSSSENIICTDDETDDGCQYAYTMNVDDTFNVTIKNTNVTLATVMYNMVTANTLDNNTRIYVNYGGNILASKWYGEIDYDKMKHDKISLMKRNEQIIFEESRHYYTTEEGNHYPTANINVSNDEMERYVIEFEAKPEDVTELREKGNIALKKFDGYNFALGNNEENNKEDKLSVSVGVNGISLIVTSSISETYSKFFDLPKYTQTIVGQDGIKWYTTLRRTPTEYNRFRIYKLGSSLKLEGIGKKNVDNINEFKDLEYDELKIWAHINATINNPSVGTRELGSKQTSIGTFTYKAIINNNSVKVTATRNDLNRQTILSYPVSINDYTKIRIDINKNDNDMFVAVLYVDDIKVGQSIEMESVPKVDIVGKSTIGTEENYFSGYIRNVRIYEVGD